MLLRLKRDKQYKKTAWDKHNLAGHIDEMPLIEMFDLNLRSAAQTLPPYITYKGIRRLQLSEVVNASLKTSKEITAGTMLPYELMFLVEQGGITHQITKQLFLPSDEVPLTVSGVKYIRRLQVSDQTIAPDKWSIFFGGSRDKFHIRKKDVMVYKNGKLTPAVVLFSKVHRNANQRGYKTYILHYTFIKYGIIETFKKFYNQDILIVDNTYPQPDNTWVKWELPSTSTVVYTKGASTNQHGLINAVGSVLSIAEQLKTEPFVVNPSENRYVDANTLLKWLHVFIYNKPYVPQAEAHMITHVYQIVGSYVDPATQASLMQQFYSTDIPAEYLSDIFSLFVVVNDRFTEWLTLSTSALFRQTYSRNTLVMNILLHQLTLHFTRVRTIHDRGTRIVGPGEFGKHINKVFAGAAFRMLTDPSVIPADYTVAPILGGSHVVSPLSMDSPPGYVSSHAVTCGDITGMKESAPHPLYVLRPTAKLIAVGEGLSRLVMLDIDDRHVELERIAKEIC